MKNFKNSSILLLLIAVIFVSCKKKKTDAHVPPDLVFKTGGIYTSGDRTLNKKDTITVGITATKTEDDLKSYNVSYTYDGNTTSTTFYNNVLTTAEAGSYSNDIKIICRNQAGTEHWIFTIIDRDGNITQKTIVLTVQ
ncbi:MAG: hypothetical protein H0U95_08200 [Bacteroidetes bacterium]|nr:hypothetical protein [Bacteroidota bacterium]